VADKLEDLFKQSREDFEKKWDDIKVFIQYGMITDEKFKDRAKKFCLLKNIDGKYFTFEEYNEFAKTLQTDKDDKVVYIYATHKEEQHSFIDAAKERGYDVLLMDSPLDSHFINMMESSLEKVGFVRVDADVAEKLINKDEGLPSKLSEDDKKKLKELIEKQLDDKNFHVMFENMSESDQPMLITQNEFMRRMKDMSALGGGGMSYMGSFPDSYNLVVNANHPVAGRIIAEEDESLRTKTISQLIDLALLSRNLLKGEKLTAFIRRSVDLI
jgi:molecular chaperone HtpG